MYGRGREGWSGQRLPGHVQWPRHLAQEDCHARQETHTVRTYSSFGRRKYKYSCAVVAGRSTFDIHLRSPARGAALRRSSWMWSCRSRIRERTTPTFFVCMSGMRFAMARKVSIANRQRTGGTKVFINGPSDAPQVAGSLFRIWRASSAGVGWRH